MTGGEEDTTERLSINLTVYEKDLRTVQPEHFLRRTQCEDTVLHFHRSVEVTAFVCHSLGDSGPPRTDAILSDFGPH